MPLKDPVCGMTVTPHSFYRLEEEGRTHYFCGASCKSRFSHHLALYGGDTALSVGARHAPLWRRVQLRWWLLLLGGMMLLALVVRQIA